MNTKAALIFIAVIVIYCALGYLMGYSKKDGAITAIVMYFLFLFPFSLGVLIKYYW